MSSSDINQLPRPSSSDSSTVKPLSDYREKYKHLIDTQIAEPSAIKTQPDRKFGFGKCAKMIIFILLRRYALLLLVPSANKRDLRSIEETLQDIRSKKKMKLSEGDDDEGGVAGSLETNR